MPTQITTRAQVNGHRFLLRRLQHALVRGDSRMIHDPMRGQMRSLMVGVVIAVLIAGSAGVLAFFKPAPNFGRSAIMLSKTDGALYVRLGETLHPALNLASARLIVGKNDPPDEVDNKFLNTVARGPMVGIVGAPNGIHGGDDLGMSSWSVCDAAARPAAGNTAAFPGIETTVLANDPVLTDSVRSSTAEEAVLTRADDTTYLIYDGVRAAVDPDDPVVSAALGLADGKVREMSRGLLNAFPLVEPIEPTPVENLGTATSYLPAEYPVGSLLRTVDSQGEQLWVVLAEGVQPVSAAAADVIRYSNPRSPASEPVSVSPAIMSDISVVDQLPVEHLPTSRPRLVDADPNRVLCLSWQRAGTDAEPTTRLLVGDRLPLEEGTRPVRLATADGSGPGLDSVYLEPGTGEYVQATGVDGAGQQAGRLFYVNDLGLRFHLSDSPTAEALGVVGVGGPEGAENAAQPAPWPVLSLLPPGPELSQQAALLVHDGMAGDPDSAIVTAPSG
ncbi:type VII secretion protein EccB [soil metagenome]